ncbi:hypothetical protein GCM10009638_04780 [Luteococcus sanguinis]
MGKAPRLSQLTHSQRPFGIKAARRAQSMARSTSAISRNASPVSSAHAATDPSLA